MHWVACEFGGFGNHKFPKNVFRRHSWHSFKLIHSTVFVQFRKKEQGGVCFPYPEALIQLLHFQVEVLRYNHFVVGWIRGYYQPMTLCFLAYYLESGLIPQYSVKFTINCKSFTVTQTRYSKGNLALVEIVWWLLDWNKSNKMKYRKAKAVALTLVWTAS